jgi:hypothetical protein
MDCGNTDSLQAQGRLSMRVMFGIAIALPLAALFCLSYLTLLALESWRDASHSLAARPGVALRRQAWSGHGRIAE